MAGKATGKLFRVALLSTFILMISCTLLVAGSGTGNTILSLVNTPEYDIRLDVGSATGPITGTQPEENDTVTIPVLMYASNTNTSGGLTLSKVKHIIYFDITQLDFVGMDKSQSEFDSIMITESRESGDICKLRCNRFPALRISILKPGKRSMD